MLALGLTVAAQAQVGTEQSKPATAQVQKATVPDTAPGAAKTEATKATPAEAKKGEQPAAGKKPAGIEAKKDQQTATKDKTTKEVKTTAIPGKKSGPETKVDKQ
jgi:hypothetical protein